MAKPAAAGRRKMSWWPQLTRSTLDMSEESSQHGEHAATPEFGDLISARIRAEHEPLAARWFARLVDLIPVTPSEVFPSGSLLDHVPELIQHIGVSIARDHDGAVAADAAIL